MNKKFLIIGVFLLTSIVVFAQKRKIEYLPTFDNAKLHFGFYVGANQNDFKISLKDLASVPDANITVDPSFGFNLGVIADLRLHKNLSLRFEPGLMTNAKKIHFNHLTSARDSVREISSTFLHVPLLLKFSTNRYNNIRPYVLGGVSYDYNFSSSEANQDDNSKSVFRTTTNNFMYEIGIGVDIYLYYFKFSPSIRGVFAINNELKPDADANSKWTGPMKYMGTRGVFITFAFE